MSMQKNWPYIIGLAGAAAVAYLWLAPKLIQHAPAPVIHHPVHAPVHRSYPAMAMPMGAGGSIAARRPVGESGGYFSVGAGPAGVTGGSGDFMYPSGVIGKPGGYGISGGYLGEAGGASRLAVA